MSTEKIVGYSLLGVGILLMIVASIQITFVFTGKAKPIQIVRAPTQKTSNVNKPTNSTPPLEQIARNPLSILESGGGLPSMIDSSVIYQTLNLTVYYFIMQFILGFGYKLSTLGVQMVRPLKLIVEKNHIADMVRAENTTTQ